MAYIKVINDKGEIKEFSEYIVYKTNVMREYGWRIFQEPKLPKPSPDEDIVVTEQPFKFETVEETKETKRKTKVK